jgi:hypothetical protein
MIRILLFILAVTVMVPFSSQAEWPNFGLERNDAQAEQPLVKNEDENDDDNSDHSHDDEGESDDEDGDENDDD